MNQKNMAILMAAVFLIAGFNVVNAADTNADSASKVKPALETKKKHDFHGKRLDFDKLKFQEHETFDAPPPPEHLKAIHPTKEEMEAKRAEIDKRLKLTDKQKKQIELKKQEDRAKMKPILEDIQAKKQEFRTILEDKSLSQADKEKKLKEVKDSMKELKAQADTLRKENMDNFESLLTEKQKKEFSKIKDEQKKEMEQRKKEFEKIKEEQKKDFEQRKKEVIPPQKK